MSYRRMLLKNLIRDDHYRSSILTERQCITKIDDNTYCTL